MSTMSCRLRARLGLAALMLGVLSAASAAPASQVGGPQKAAQSAARSRASSATFVDAPSGESQAARERRLKRECRGRPNAGMCLGFTR